MLISFTVLLFCVTITWNYGERDNARAHEHAKAQREIAMSNCAKCKMTNSNRTTKLLFHIIIYIVVDDIKLGIAEANERMNS